VKEIPLTKGQVAIADDADYEWLSRWKWQAHWNKGTRSFYASRADYSNGRNAQRVIIMHREIIGATEGQHADHVNHGTLDNRRANLRFATSSQNSCSRRKQTNNTSGYKAVNWEKNKNKWRARIKLNGKKRSLGYFTDPVLAAQAYDKAALELHGEFACINFPVSLTPLSAID
jgi:hypothetical protein